MANFFGNDGPNATNGGIGVINYYGLDGADLLAGNELPNEIFGMGGNDMLVGGRIFSNLPVAGAGTPDDPFRFYQDTFFTSGSDVIEGGSGSDRKSPLGPKSLLSKRRLSRRWIP
jgi:hypothetical protein